MNVNLIELMNRFQNEFERELEKRILSVVLKGKTTPNKVIKLEDIRDSFCEVRTKIMREKIAE